MKKQMIFIGLLLHLMTGTLLANPLGLTNGGIVAEGTRLLRERIALNSSLSASGQDRASYTIVIGDEDSGGDGPNQLTTERQINGFKGFFSADAAANSAALTRFNNRLTALNAGKPVKVYYLLINGFSLEYKAAIDSGTAVQSIFNSPLVDKNTAMQQYQQVHDSLATAIFDNVFGSVGAAPASTIAIAVGHYHLVDFTIKSQNQTVTEYYYCKLFPPEQTYLGTDDPRTHLTDIYRSNLIDLGKKAVADFKYSSTDSLMGDNLTALESAYNKYKAKDSLLYVYTVAGIKRLLVNFGTGDFAGLRLAERVHILSVLVGENMFGNWGINSIVSEEQLALQVLQTTPATDAERLLIALKQPSVVGANPLYLLHNSGNSAWSATENQTAKNYALLRRLIRGIDDGPFGTRYAELILAVKRLVVNASGYNERYSQAVENFDKRTLSVGKPRKPFPGERAYSDVAITDDGYIKLKSEIYYPPQNTTFNPKRPLDFLQLPEGLEPLVEPAAGVTSFDDNNFYERLKDFMGASGSGLQLLGSPTGGSHYRSAPELFLDPYDLVMVTLNTDVASVRDGAGQSMDSAQKVFFVPAVFLYYTKDKLRNHVLGTTARVAADLLIVATTFGTGAPGVAAAEGILGGGETLTASQQLVRWYAAARRAMAVYNGVCAGIDLAIVITNAEQNPKFKTFVKWFQFAQILGAGGELGLGITRSVAVNGARFITRVPVLTPKVKDGCKLFIQAWQEYKLAAMASGLRSGANPSGMIADQGRWAGLSDKCDALAAQMAIWFPELLQRIDVSIDGLYDAAKAMRARVAANNNVFSSVVPLTPKTAAAIAYGFAYCLKVGKDATKRSLAGLLQHIRTARGQINGLEAVPDELVDEVGRLQAAEFEGFVALADDARLTTVEDAVAGFNIAGNSMETAGKLASVLGEKFNAVLTKCKQMGLSKGQMETLLQDFANYKNFLAAVKADVNALNDWKKLEDIITVVKNDFPAGWKYRKADFDVYEIFDGSNRKLAAAYKDKIVAPGRVLSGMPGNKILNKEPLLKNMTYEVDGFIYKTDDLGRVFYTDADLDNIMRVRLGNQQIRAVDVKDGVRGTDQGGHIIGSRFFGPGEQINLYPMTANLNLTSWKQMENIWADALVGGKDVKVKIGAVYEGASKRPVGFEVDYWIDGQINTRTFANN